MFLLEYLKSPRNIGAIAPSSRYLAKSMLSTLSWPSLKHIVEYGPGTGVFTEAILRNMGQRTTLILVEANERFYERLRSRYGALENVKIIHGGAENILEYVADLGNPRIDCVVSGLPFTSLPGDTTQAILSRTAQLLGADGVFITFQYTLLKKELFDRFFQDIRLRHTWRNIPPAYVLECRVG